MKIKKMASEIRAEVRELQDPNYPAVRLRCYFASVVEPLLDAIDASHETHAGSEPEAGAGTVLYFPDPEPEPELAMSLRQAAQTVFNSYLRWGAELPSAESIGYWTEFRKAMADLKAVLDRETNADAG